MRPKFLVVMPEGTKKEAKERQGQNPKTGKNLLPDFHMKIKFARFVFTNQLRNNQNELVFMAWRPFDMTFGKLFSALTSEPSLFVAAEIFS